MAKPQVKPQVKVRAIKTGWHGLALREVGDVFEVDKGQKASWFVPADEADVSPSKKASGGTEPPPETSSESSGEQDDSGAP